MLSNNVFSKLKSKFLTYCKNTSLHGFIYVFREKSLIDKIFWLLTCVSCLIFALYLMLMQFVGFYSNVTNTELKTNIYPVWKAPFPAVTICSYNSIHAERTGYYNDLLLSHNYKQEDIKDFFIALDDLKNIHHASNEIFVNGNKDLVEEMLDTLNKVGINITALMKDLSHPCEEMIAKCFWMSNEYDCKILFKQIKTTFGFCCSFNYFGSSEMQKLDKQKQSELYYSSGAGVSFGLKVEIDMHESSYASKDEQKGVKVLVHTNYAYPDLSLLSYLIESNSQVTLSLSTSTLMSSSDIKNINPDQRKCLMEDENFLQSTNVYNFETCLSECRMEYMRMLCGCVPYYSPLNYSETCSFKHVKCLQENEVRLANLALKTDEGDEENEELVQRLSEDALSCYCLPNCDEISVVTFIENNPKTKADSCNNTSNLRVYYKSSSMLQTLRKPNITWDVLFASFGGIFSLALGGSVFNILEVIYYVFSDLLNSAIKYVKKKFFKKNKRRIAARIDDVYIIYCN